MRIRREYKLPGSWANDLIERAEEMGLDVQIIIAGEVDVAEVRVTGERETVIEWETLGANLD